MKGALFSIFEGTLRPQEEAAAAASQKKANFMAPFYGWGSTASRLEPLRGGSLLFTTKFAEIAGTHFIDRGKMKG